MQSNQSTIFSKIRFRTAKTNEPDHMRYIANSRHNPDKYKRSEDAEHLIYAATRPRAAGGLFGPNGPEDLKQSMAEIEARQNPLSWRIICSLREDDAQRLGYVSPAAWQDLTKRVVAQFARATKIAPQNLCWRAGHHNEPGHPHVHVILWLKDGAPTRRGKLSAEELREFRRGQAREIFGPLRVQLAAEKTEARNTMLAAIRGNVTEVERLIKCAELEMQVQDPVGIRSAPGFSSQDLDTLASNINALATIMPGKGQVKLAFMPPDVKEEVKRIADWLMARPELKEARASYETASVQLAMIYTADPKKLREAEQNARDDLRDRMAQVILNAAAGQNKRLRVNVSTSSDREKYRDKVWLTRRTPRGLKVKLANKPTSRELQFKQRAQAHTVARTAWRTLERERLKAQAQAELASLREAERAESRGKEHNGRER